MNKRVIFSFLYFIFIACSGCIPLNSRDLTELKGEIAQLKIEFKELKQDRTDLSERVNSDVYSLETLNNTVKELQNEVFSLKQSMKNFKVDVNAGIDNNTNAKKITVSILPSSVYQSAYSDYVAGKYELAYNSFQSFVEKYPNSELAPQAQFYLGESLYSRKMWQNAIKEYKKIEELYSKTNLVASSKFKIALCYENLGLKQEALKVFSSIVDNFPNSSEFLTAKEKIKTYNNVENK